MSLARVRAALLVGASAAIAAGGLTGAKAECESTGTTVGFGLVVAGLCAALVVAVAAIAPRASRRDLVVLAAAAAATVALVRYGSWAALIPIAALLGWPYVTFARRPREGRRSVGSSRRDFTLALLLAPAAVFAWAAAVLQCTN